MQIISTASAKHSARRVELCICDGAESTDKPVPVAWPQDKEQLALCRRPSFHKGHIVAEPGCVFWGKSYAFI